ncbi:hypothetical protein Tco_1279718 [Tanacetum coccineum]
MIELDGATSVRKTSVKGGGFVRYPFQLKELGCIELTDNKYLIDVAGYVTNVGLITQQKSGSQTLDFSLANGSLILDDTQIPALNALREENSEDEVSLSQAAVHADYSQVKEGTAVEYLVLRLELDVSNKTASTVVVMFDEPTIELVKCSADSLAVADEDVGFAYADDVGLPRALANNIGTTQTLEIKTHTYYEHGTFESFTCWRIPLEEVVEEDVRSSNYTSVEVKIKKFRKLATKPSVATPSKPAEKRGKRVDLEDSHDEVTCGMDDGQAYGKDNFVLDKRKKKRYIVDDSASE